MDTFRAEMMRLAERQTRLEAIQEIHARARGAEDWWTKGLPALLQAVPEPPRFLGGLDVALRFRGSMPR